MSQVIVLTLAAVFVRTLRNWRRNAPELTAAKVKSAAKKVEDSAGSVEVALDMLMVTIANERRSGPVPRLALEEIARA